MFQIDVSELNRLQADLAGVDSRLGSLVSLVMRKTAYDIERTAKGFVPVDTGNLRSSISHSDLRKLGTHGTMEVEIGPTASYGHFVEFGTSRMAPYAYMGPALDRHGWEFQQAMAQVAARGMGL